MQLIENNALFTQISAKESTTASGGSPVTANLATLGFLLANANGTLTNAQVATVNAIALAPRLV